MKEQPIILFCESPFEIRKVDEDFIDEFHSAINNGFSTILFSYEDLVNGECYSVATKLIPVSQTLQTVIYRGWMLTIKQYEDLYNGLLIKNYKLKNTVDQYRNCHYLPDSLKFIEPRTPRTVFEKFEDETSIDHLIEKSEIFGQKSVILKDYVKSEKHDWDTACFVKNASDIADFKKIVLNLIKLRGKYLNEGIVAREFIELNDLAIHSKSGMPLREEYRLFFCSNKLLGIYEYWEEGEYKLAKPDTKEFEEIAAKIESNFFSMDVARQKNGELIIIELGDGQVSGLPDKLNRNEFYKQLKYATLNS